MAYTKTKKNIDADNDYLSKKSAVENYGTLNDHISDRTNKLQQGLDAAADAVKNYGDFNASELLTQKGQQKQDAENAVSNYGDFEYALQNMYGDVMNQILNREKFSYDVNGDALYQQYKDQYINQGKMAMMDTMGQAAAMTGGYGNSYAQSVGQQAYQGYLQQLTDKIPELYSLALDKYNSEGQDLYNKYSLLSSDRATQYGEWSDAYNRLVADRDYTASDYYNLYGNEYNAYTDKYNRLGDAYNIASDMYNTSWNQDYTGFETGLNQAIDLRDAAGKYADTVYGQEYGEYTDKQAHDLALAQLAEEQRQFNKQFEANTGYTTDGKRSELYADADAQAAEEQAKLEEVLNGKVAKTFMAAVLTPTEFNRRGKQTQVGGKTKRFDNYKQYIDAVLESQYKSGKLTENETAALKGYYGIE